MSVTHFSRTETVPVVASSKQICDNVHDRRLQGREQCAETD